MSIDLPNAPHVLDMEVLPQAATRRGSIRLLEEIQPRFFDACPICADPATANEHVPPASLNGRIMTRTCAPCNHRPGSNVEADLVDWYDNALTQARFTSANVQGSRPTGRILVRTGSAGEAIFVIDGRADPAVKEMLESGYVELSARQPDRNRVRLALLKHAYLAACLQFGIPQGPGADAVRRDLIAARDSRQRTSVPQSSLALGLTLLRLDRLERPVSWPVIWAVIDEPDGACHGVLLGGRTFVSWSSMPPSAQASDGPPRIQVPLLVGGRMTGTVGAVQTQS